MTPDLYLDLLKQVIRIIGASHHSQNPFFDPGYVPIHQSGEAFDFSCERHFD
jgi:hypothetical protein